MGHEVLPNFDPSMPNVALLPSSLSHLGDHFSALKSGRKVAVGLCHAASSEDRDLCLLNTKGVGSNSAKWFEGELPVLAFRYSAALSP